MSLICYRRENHHTNNTHLSSHTITFFNRPAQSKATLGDRSCFLGFFYLEDYSKLCQIYPIKVIIYVSSNDLLVSSCLGRLNFFICSLYICAVEMEEVLCDKAKTLREFTYLSDRVDVRLK